MRGVTDAGVAGACEVDLSRWLSLVDSCRIGCRLVGDGNCGSSCRYLLVGDEIDIACGVPLLGVASQLFLLQRSTDVTHHTRFTSESPVRGLSPSGLVASSCGAP